MDARGLGPGIPALTRYGNLLSTVLWEKRHIADIESDPQAGGDHCTGPAINASSNGCRDAENGSVTVTPFQVKPS